MANPLDFAMRMIEGNPSVGNNAVNRNYIDILKRGDSTQGRQIADNLCQTYGVSYEEAVRQAKSFFGIKV